MLYFNRFSLSVSFNLVVSLVLGLEVRKSIYTVYGSGVWQRTTSLQRLLLHIAFIFLFVLSSRALLAFKDTVQIAGVKNGRKVSGLCQKVAKVDQHCCCFISSYYQVIVVQLKEGQDPGNPADPEYENVVASYDNKKEGEPYITAEFLSEVAEETFTIGDGKFYSRSGVTVSRRKRRDISSKFFLMI